MDIQYGGGKCSLCGSDGTNKSTCPLNPMASNKNYSKHPDAMMASMASIRKNPEAQRADAPKMDPMRLPDLVFENMLKYLDNHSLLNLYKASSFYDRQRIRTYLKYKNKKVYELLDAFIRFGTRKFQRNLEGLHEEIEYAASKNILALYISTTGKSAEIPDLVFSQVSIFKLVTVESQRAKIEEKYTPPCQDTEFYRKLEHKVFDIVEEHINASDNTPQFVVSNNWLVTYHLNNKYELCLMENPIHDIFTYMLNSSVIYDMLEDIEDPDQSSDEFIEEIATVIVDNFLTDAGIDKNLRKLSDAYEVWSSNYVDYYRGSVEDMQNAGIDTSELERYVLFTTV